MKTKITIHTIGALRELIRNLPDDMPVSVEGNLPLTFELDLKEAPKNELNPP